MQGKVITAIYYWFAIGIMNVNGVIVITGNFIESVFRIVFPLLQIIPKIHTRKQFHTLQTNDTKLNQHLLGNQSSVQQLHQTTNHGP